MKKIKHSIQKITIPIIGVLCFVVACLVIYNGIRSSVEHSEVAISKPPSSWIMISNDELGITLSVPPHIIAYENKDNLNGCKMSLVIGVVEASTSAFLMPEFTDCTKKISLRWFYSSDGNPFAKRITILPATNSSEIQGIVLSHVMNNSLITVPYYIRAECVRDSLKIILNDVHSRYKDATIPVIIHTRPECPVDPHAISVQYSSEFKKVILIESMYGFAEKGDFYIEHTDLSDKTVDLDIYRSIKVFR